MPEETNSRFINELFQESDEEEDSLVWDTHDSTKKEEVVKNEDKIGMYNGNTAHKNKDYVINRNNSNIEYDNDVYNNFLANNDERDKFEQLSEDSDNKSVLKNIFDSSSEDFIIGTEKSYDEKSYMEKKETVIDDKTKFKQNQEKSEINLNDANTEKSYQTNANTEKSYQTNANTEKSYQNNANTEKSYQNNANTDNITSYQNNANTEKSYQTNANTEKSYQNNANTDNITSYQTNANTDNITSYQNNANTDNITSYQNNANNANTEKSYQNNANNANNENSEYESLENGRDETSVNNKYSNASNTTRASNYLKSLEFFEKNMKKVENVNNITKLKRKKGVFPLCAHIGGMVIGYSVVSRKKYQDGGIVSKEHGIFEFWSVVKPQYTLMDDDKMGFLLKMNKETPIDEVERVLGIKPISMAEDIQMPRSFIENLLLYEGDNWMRFIFDEIVKSKYGMDKNNAEISYSKYSKNSFISSQNANEVLVRRKLRLGGDLTGVSFDAGYLRYILKIKDRDLAVKFVNDQSMFVYFFALFYRQGLVKINDFPERFYNNIFCSDLIKKINVSEDITNYKIDYFITQERSAWSIKSLLDFSISKILDVEPSGNNSIDKFTVNTVDDLSSNKIKNTNLTIDKPDNSNLNANKPEDSNLIVDKEFVNNKTLTDFNNNEILPKIPENTKLTRKEISNNSNYNHINDNKSNDFKNITDNKSNDFKNITDNKSNDFENITDNKSNDFENITDNKHNNFQNEGSGIYKKKFSKSFVDIFTMEKRNTCASADLSSFVDDVNENDRPMLVKEYEEDSKRSFYNVFGLFKRKFTKTTQGQGSADEELPQSSGQPIKLPESVSVKMKNAPTSIYANKKNVSIVVETEENDIISS